MIAHAATYDPPRWHQTGPFRVLLDAGYEPVSWGYGAGGMFTVTVRASQYATPPAPDWARYDPFRKELELRRQGLPPRKQPFFPASTRAPTPERRPVFAPLVKPVQRLLHFASPRVQARRNRATPPRKDTT